MAKIRPIESDDHSVIVTLINAQFSALQTELKSSQDLMVEKITNSHDVLFNEIQQVKTKQDLTNGTVKAHSTQLKRVLVMPKGVKNWGYLIAGIVLIFYGLHWLSSTVPFSAIISFLKP